MLSRRLRAVQEPKLLVVEPRLEVLEEVSAQLRESGAKVAALTRQQAAGPLCSAFNPDAALVGVSANLEGLEVGRALRQLSRGSLPVIYLLPADPGGLRELCLQKGFGVDALTLPLDARGVFDKVLALMRLRTGVERVARAGTEPHGAFKDRLTGLASKRLLLALTAAELRRSERYGGVFSLLRVRLHGFSSFQERFGTAHANRLVIYASVVLAQTLREADAVARIGDRELAALLPGAGAEVLPRVLERVASRFSHARLQLDERLVKVSAAVGGASFPEVVGTPAQMLAAARQGARSPGLSTELRTFTAVEG